MPELIRIVVTVAEERAETLAGVLALNVSHGWEEAILPDGSVQNTVFFTHASGAKALTAALHTYLPDATILSDMVEEENWAEAWKEYFTPVKGGRHFYVLAPWMEEERKKTALTPIIIEPKTAFGTGHHATTALCLDAISALFDKNCIQAGDRFLDLGTGSGILGIAACTLGLTGEGLDIDVVAVDNAVENRELNGIKEEAFALALGGVEGASGPYRLVLANILAGPLIAMAADVVSLVEKNGTLVLSGILEIQADSVEAAYCSHGLILPERYIRGEWVSLVFACS